MKQRTLLEVKKADELRRLLDANPPRCKVCSSVIPAPKRYNNNATYCTDRCASDGRNQLNQERRALKAAQQMAAQAAVDERIDGLYPETSVRRGPVYDNVVATLDQRVIDDWIDHKYSDVEIRKMMGAGSYQVLGAVRKALFNDRILGVAAQGWRPEARFAAMLGPSDRVMEKLKASDPDAYERKLDELVKAFVKWRSHFFSTGRGGYITRPMHRDWIRAVLNAIYTGTRVMILSPPRHGKTELLIHFCDWQIIRNSDIRILWVGPNTDIAENCLGQVKNLLETHEELVRAYLPPGAMWAPASRRSGNTWAADKFTVATRTQPQKQPTMWCTGVEGKIQSLDADFIVVDDPADPDKSYTAGGRARIDNWFKVKLLSRKMDFTGLVMISSRVHPLDLFEQFLDSPRWKVIINKAHDQTICSLDLFTPHPGDGVKEGCVLFPEMNPLRYLREQHDDVGDALFEMMYLNQPRPDGTLIFDPDIIRMRCLHPNRDLGTKTMVGPFRLVAGLDPAAKGVQAAFLWAVQEYQDPHTKKPKFLYHMIDLETQQGGGIEGAMKVMKEWLDKYGCNLWVVEDNAFQGVFFTDLRFRRFLNDENITMRPTNTGGNKYDGQYGVSSLAPKFHDGEVILPYASLEARRKTDSLIRQLVSFTNEGGTKRPGTSDILMAAWFPHATVIRRWVKDAMGQVTWDWDADESTSYPGYTGGTYDELPWPAQGYSATGSQTR